MEKMTSEPVQVSFPLPRGMDTKIHMRLTVQSKAILLFVTTVAAEDSDKPAPMGAFVYALPDVSPTCFLPTASQIASLLCFVEVQSVPASVNNNLLNGGDPGVHYASCQVTGEENKYARLCGKLNKFC